jgi:hypothetical protein
VALTSEDIQIIATIVSQMLHEKGVTVTEHGVMSAGSWSATDNAGQQIDASTAEATSGKTAAILGDDGDTGLAKPRLNLATMAVGDQYGPIGGERVLIIPTESGPVALMIHGADDSPGAPSGERWITHRNPKTLGMDAFVKLTNDGASAGNGKGGIKINAASFFSAVTTGGNELVMDDVGKLFTVQSVSGGALIINDTSQQITISYGNAAVIFDKASGTFQICGSGTSSSDGIVRQSDLQAHITEVKTYINAHTHTGVQTGGGTSATVASPYSPANASASAKAFTA